MSRKDIESTLNEVRILCSIENEFVVGYKDAFLDKNDSELCIGRTYETLDQLSHYQYGNIKSSFGYTTNNKFVFGLLLNLFFGLKFHIGK